MKIRDIIHEDETPVPKKLPRQLTGGDVAALQDPNPINALALVAQDPNTHEDAESLAQQVSRKEQVQNQQQANAQPWANTFSSVQQDPALAQKFNQVVGQAQQAAQAQQQAAQARQVSQQAGPYGQRSASTNKPNPPRKPGQ